MFRRNNRQAEEIHDRATQRRYTCQLHRDPVPMDWHEHSQSWCCPECDRLEAEAQAKAARDKARHGDKPAGRRGWR